jgi:microcystin-dependent protein
MAPGPGYVLGQTGGQEMVTLNGTQYPAHSHQLMASGAVENSTNPQGNVLGAAALYVQEPANNTMAAAGLSSYNGGSQPHENRQPFQAFYWIIALYGVYPTQN